MKIDLHAHTTASDGRLLPAELVAMAAKIGLNYLAITDHDTISGVASAQAAANEHALSIIPGVEISVTWKRQTIHILGLNIDIQQPDLLAGLAHLQTRRYARAQRIAEALEKIGVQAPLAEAQKLASGVLISRSHFAQVLVDQGFSKDIKSVFKHYLVPKKPGFVNVEWVSLTHAVGWINAAGGNAAIAHPARYRLTRTKLLALISDFKQAGGEGLEVVSSSHSHNEIHNMADIAEKTALLSSAGSDYHGIPGQWGSLGQIPSLPKRCQPIWAKWGLLDA